MHSQMACAHVANKCLPCGILAVLSHLNVPHPSNSAIYAVTNVPCHVRCCKTARQPSIVHRRFLRFIFAWLPKLGLQPATKAYGMVIKVSEYGCSFAKARDYCGR